MNYTPRHHSSPSRTRQLIATVRDDLRDRRRARTQGRNLERDLATYSTPSDVNDLLATIASDGSAEAERMRSMLARNMRHYQRVSVAS
ncbi:MAG: hypothetical protein ABIN79_13350 [Marmoricola sp.]